MRSAVAIATLLGAGAIAHPSFEHRHPHNRRDKFVTSTMVNEVLVEDFKDPVTVTVTAGQLPSPQPFIPLPVPEKLAVEASPAAPLSVTPIATPTQISKAAPSLPPASSSMAAAAPASAPASSSPEGSGTFWATSPMSPLGGGSGAKDILTQANYWRKQWKGLPPFTWSSLLANNAYMTAMNVEFTKPEPDLMHGMEHKLYPGSFSQCEGAPHWTTVTPQGLTPFELAFLGWICETPTSNIITGCNWLYEPYIPLTPLLKNETDHAAIIGGTVSQIGCYFRDHGGDGIDNSGIWTCDFAYGG